MTKKEDKTVKEEEEEEEKPKEEEKADDTPQWAIKLGGKFDKMADAFTKLAEVFVNKQAEDEEEEEPKEEEKQDEEEEEEEPKEEEKQDDEEEEEPKEEEKVKKGEFFEEDADKIKGMIKEEVAKLVEAALKKNLETPAKKRSKAIKKISKVSENESMAKLLATPWKDIHRLAEERGA